MTHTIEVKALIYEIRAWMGKAKKGKESKRKKWKENGKRNRNRIMKSWQGQCETTQVFVMAFAFVI